MKLDWNHERHRTRDRLLDYEFGIYPTSSDIPELSVIYPWENLSPASLEDRLLALAHKNGYEGDDDAFWAHFANGKIHEGLAADFPSSGIQYDLYLDVETSILYYFDKLSDISESDLPTSAIITSNENNLITAYIPVRSLLINDTILNSDDATEYLD